MIFKLLLGCDLQEPSVVLHPKYTTYEGNCYWSAKLTFLPSSIKLNVSEEEAPMGPLTYEWKTVDLICIESKWLDPVSSELRFIVLSTFIFYRFTSV